MQLEPVSPELVLIDPELARRERARLEEKAYLQSVLDVASLRRAAESQPPVAETVQRRTQWREATTFAQRRVVPAALLCSLAANGFLVAHFVARGDGQEAAQVAVRMVTLTESAPTVATPVPAVSTALPRTKSAVERKVVALILSAPARRLPRDLIDSTTGLVKNNVQVVCTEKSQRRSFLCAVRLSSDRTNKALYVRYRTDKNGRGGFKWYGYKPS